MSGKWHHWTQMSARSVRCCGSWAAGCQESPQNTWPGSVREGWVARCWLSLVTWNGVAWQPCCVKTFRTNFWGISEWFGTLKLLFPAWLWVPGHQSPCEEGFSEAVRRDGRLLSETVRGGSGCSGLWGEEGAAQVVRSEGDSSLRLWGEYGAARAVRDKGFPKAARRRGSPLKSVRDWELLSEDLRRGGGSPKLWGDAGAALAGHSSQQPHPRAHLSAALN